MSKSKKQKELTKKSPKKNMVDIDKLKSFGITKDPNEKDIEEIDGTEIGGGKQEDTTVDTLWPTNTGTSR